MIYARGPNLDIMNSDSTNGYAHAARLAFELGCNIVKTVWTGSKESFSKVVKAAPIPVMLAGGPAQGDGGEVLEMVEQAMSVGAAGVCMGRQIFSSPNPEGMIKALRAIIHEGYSAQEASRYL
jgi:class I fructose-bisphosphate aldolase